MDGGCSRFGSDVGHCMARTLFAALFLLVPSSRALAACEGAVLTSTRPTLDVDGLTRSFIVRIPPAYDGRTRVPLVFAFHPFGTNGDYMASRAPISRVWREAISIYPTGAPRPGSGAAPAWQSGAGDAGDRDLHFFDAMLAWAREHACIDPQRVFVFGYSNGAGFAYLLACERPSAIAGLAIASGRLGCHPPQPKRVIINHGSFDATISYNEALRAAAAWSSINGCAAPPKPVADGCATASRCGAGPVTLCTYAGGHEYHAAFTETAVDFLKP